MTIQITTTTTTTVSLPNIPLTPTPSCCFSWCRCPGLLLYKIRSIHTHRQTQSSTYRRECALKYSHKEMEANLPSHFLRRLCDQSLRSELIRNLWLYEVVECEFEVLYSAQRPSSRTRQRFWRMMNKSGARQKWRQI